MMSVVQPNTALNASTVSALTALLRCQAPV
jgi:hypothetical protein